MARHLYMTEITALTERLNRLIPKGQLQLQLPALSFNRHIGSYAGQPYSVPGKLLSPEAHAQHLLDVLPQQEDFTLLAALTKTADWIAPKKATA